MTYTTNFELKKPGDNDFYDIGDHNDNMDVIDEAMGDFYEEVEEHETTLGNHTSTINAHTASINSNTSAINANTSAIANNEKALCRTNLLDNWYFPNAVNQRGEDYWNYEYEGVTVDRWRKDANRPAALLIGQLGIVFNPNTSSSLKFYQVLDEKTYNSIKGKKFTLSAVSGSSSGMGSAYTLFFKRSGQYGSTDANYMKSSVTSLTLSDVTEDYDPDYPPYVGVKAVNTGIINSLTAIKLEIGGTQTLARMDGNTVVLNDVPDYGEQLLRCKRFYQVLNFTGCVGYAQTVSGVKKAMIGVPLPVDMDESIQTATITSYSVGSVMTSSGTTQTTGVTKPDTKLSGVENTPTDGCFAILVSVSTTSILNGYPVVATGVSVTLSTEE